MTDYIVRATAADSQIRAFAATTREMTEYARKVHEESPVACAALGRLMTAGAMMGAMMKGDKDLLTLQIRADGPLRGMTVTADAKGNVKGFAGNPQVMLPPNALGKLDVGGAVGHVSAAEHPELQHLLRGQLRLEAGVKIPAGGFRETIAVLLLHQVVDDDFTRFHREFSCPGNSSRSVAKPHFLTYSTSSSSSSSGSCGVRARIQR